MKPMNPRDRLLGTLGGQAVDRVPVFTCIPFEVTAEGFKPGPIHAYDEYDAWREKDPAYGRLVRGAETRMDASVPALPGWGPTRPPGLGAGRK